MDSYLSSQHGTGTISPHRTLLDLLRAVNDQGISDRAGSVNLLK